MSPRHAPQPTKSFAKTLGLPSYLTTEAPWGIIPRLYQSFPVLPCSGGRTGSCDATHYKICEGRGTGSSRIPRDGGPGPRPDRGSLSGEQRPVRKDRRYCVKCTRSTCNTYQVERIQWLT